MLRGMKVRLEKVMKWLARGSSGSGRGARSGGARRFVPSVEQLPDRILPANLLFVGGNGVLWSANNVWEDMQSGQLNVAPPKVGDSLFFNPSAPIPPNGTVAPTNNPSTDDIVGLKLNQVYIDPSFGANVTFQQDLTIQANFTDNGTGNLLNAGGVAHKITVDPAGGNATAYFGGPVNASVQIDLAAGTSTIITAAAQKTFTGSLTNAGTVNWNDGNISIGDGLGNSGTFNINCSKNLNGNTNFRNSGSLSVATNGTVTIATPFINSGSFELSQGTVNFTGGASQAAVQTASTFLRSNTTLEVNSGGGTYTLDSGKFSGDQATFMGTLANNAGTVSAMTGIGAPSTLSIIGDYTQGAQGTMWVVASRTANSVINVSAFVTGGGGVATLGGTVTFVPYANDLPGTTPAGGVAFLTYVSRVGNFATQNTTAPNGWNDMNGVNHKFLTANPNMNGSEYDMNIS